jgi:hypothetical protein
MMIRDGTIYRQQNKAVLIFGFITAWQAPKVKRLTIGAFVAGTGSFFDNDLVKPDHCR